MTVPYERTRAVIDTYRFLRRLFRQETPAPYSVRQTALWLERHYPSPHDHLHGRPDFSRVFADPYEATAPIQNPRPVASELCMEMTERQSEELLDIPAHMRVSQEFDRRRCVDQWIELPHPGLQGDTPRDVAGRPGGFDEVWRDLVGLADPALQ